jgi:hypothetical protein
MAAAAAEETSARETVGRYLGTHLYAVGRKGGGQSRRTTKAAVSRTFTSLSSRLRVQVWGERVEVDDGGGLSLFNSFS